MADPVDRRTRIRRRSERITRIVERAALGVLVVLYLLGFKANGDRVEQINQERARNIERNCADVNQRHDNTLRALETVLDRAREGASSERLRQIEQSRQSTTLLIDALAPKRRCAELAAQQVTE